MLVISTSAKLDMSACAARLKVGIMITGCNQHRQMDEFCESVKIGFSGCALRLIEDPVYFKNY